MPYGLGSVWNVTSKYIYNDPDKNVGIGTISPICALDVFGNIAEKGITLEDKYNLKPENNKKYDLIVREKLNDSIDSLIISYQFNKESFDYNLSTLSYGTLHTIGTRKALQKEYYVGTGSAEINNNLYYNIALGTTEFTSQKYTICFWLFLNEECNTNTYILYSTQTDNNIIRNFSLKYNTNKTLTFIPYYTSSELYVFTKTIDKNKWYHISIIIDNSITNSKNLQININGVKDFNHAFYNNDIINGNKNLSANIYLGYSNYNTINGYIDDFRIYQSVLDTTYINTNIIGKITKITPGNIGANGNYGIDIINYCNLVNIGSTTTNVDLEVYGNLKVKSLSLTSTIIPELYSSNLIVYENTTIHKDLTVNKDIIENQRKLSEKYSLIGSIDKHTDVIISKMIDTDDVLTLYNTMSEYFRSNLILAYNFDFNKDNLNDKDYFFSNFSKDLNDNTNNIYTEFAKYNVTPNTLKSPVIDYYGNKYVKGNSSLQCHSTSDYYSFITNSTDINATFHSGENYTITFWVRFTRINQKQHIFKFGDPTSYVNLYLTTSNILEFENRTDASTSYNTKDLTTNTINNTNFNKDEWYHISILLKNYKSIEDIPKNEPEDKTLIDSFAKLGYTYDNTNPQYYIFNTTLNIATVFIYINGIHVCEQSYPVNKTIFDSIKNANTNYLGAFDTTTGNILNGFIDDFKMYNTLIPITYINEYIIGDALVIKPGQLSAIGNYGINIKNFKNEVTVGNDTNYVDLSIYGILKSFNNKITISNVDISVNNNNLITSNLLISNTLTTNCNIANNIQIINTIKGPGFILGSNDSIDTIKILNITNNSNITTSNIRVDNIIVNKTLVLDNSTIQKLNVININIDSIVKSSNNYITIYSNLIIGDESTKNKRYDFGKDIGSTLRTVNPEFLFDNANILPALANIKILSSSNVSIYDKPFIFHGIDNSPDIHMKNAYIREDNCNIKLEILKSNNVDRNRTRIKTDVGNITVQNGYMLIYDYDILKNTDNTTSTLKLQEDDININHSSFNLNLNSNGYYFSNSLYNTTLNDTLTIRNNEKYSKLTSSNFVFNNGKGFTDNTTLEIDKIIINTELQIPTINTNNPDPTTFSINTSNTENPFGRIQGFLSDNSKIDINYEIKTSSNVQADKGIFNVIDAPKIISSNLIIGTTDITSNQVKVANLVVTGSIRLGQGQSSENNNIDGGEGTLQIATIKTTNPNSNIFSIDTLNTSNLGRIRAYISSNSIIDIDCNITTKASIYTSNLITSNTISAFNIKGLDSTLCRIRGHIIEDSIIDINCNITTTASIYTPNLTTSNTIYASNLTGVNNTLCRIRGHIIEDSLINTNCNITTTATVITSNLITNNTISASNLTGVNNTLCRIRGHIIEDSLINTNCNITTTATVITSNLITNNTISASNLNGLNNTLCRIRGHIIDDSLINTNCNITTTATVNTSNLITSNTISASNLNGLNNGLCRIRGHIIDDSLINTYCNIITTATVITSNLTTNNIISALQLQGIDSTLCRIRGNIIEDSIINTNGNITTTALINVGNTTISSNIITTSNIITSNISTHTGTLNINAFLNATNYNIKCSQLDVNNINNSNLITTPNMIVTNNTTTNTLTTNTINSSGTLTITAPMTNTSLITAQNLSVANITDDFIIKKSLKTEPSSISGGIAILSNNSIQCYDTNTNASYMKLDGKGLKSMYNNSPEYNIIYYDTTTQNLTIKCQSLVVEKFDVGDGSKFSFPNIISYNKNITVQIPNVYIGYNDVSLSTIKNDKDVLFVNTPNNTRLRTGNLLVEAILEIGEDTANNPYSMKIFTGRLNIPTATTTNVSSAPFTNFTTYAGDTIISCSHDNKSVGINVQPPSDTGSTIKLFVDGGIQTSDDIIAFKNISDRRFKTNIVSFTDEDIDIVNKLNPVRFKWIPNLFNANMANKEDIGFIAQEVKECIPEAVSTCKIELNDIDYNYIKYERIIPYLVNNIKYLNNKIVELENKLNGL